MDNYRNLISLVTLPLLLSLNAKSANAEDYFINQSFRNCAIDNFATSEKLYVKDLVYSNIQSMFNRNIENSCLGDMGNSNDTISWEECLNYNDNKRAGLETSQRYYPVFCKQSDCHDRKFQSRFCKQSTCYIRKDKNTGCSGSYNNDQNIKNPILIPKPSSNLEISSSLLKNLTIFINRVKPAGLKKGYKSYNLNNCKTCGDVVNCNLEDNEIVTCFANNTGNYEFIKFNKTRVILPTKTADHLSETDATTSSSKETLSPTETKTSNGNSLLSKSNLIKSISLLSGVFSFITNF